MDERSKNKMLARTSLVTAFAYCVGFMLLAWAAAILFPHGWSSTPTVVGNLQISPPAVIVPVTLIGVLCMARLQAIRVHLGHRYISARLPWDDWTFGGLLPSRKIKRHG